MVPAITLEKLAEMVAEGFLELGQRLAVMQGDLDRLREEVVAQLRLVNERIATLEHGMVDVRDALALAPRGEALEAHRDEVLETP
jgi:hypothetical protein